MYAKTLIPGPPVDMPTLTGTTSRMDILLSQLIQHGWAPYGQDLTRPTSTTLELGVDQNLRLVVAGEAILDSLNPIAPPGWWEACEKLGGRCVVVVLRTSDVDLTDPEVATTMRRLLDEPGSGAWAVVPLEHPL